MISFIFQGIDCQLAIETSGHAAFEENQMLDDGAYLALKVRPKLFLAVSAQGANSMSENICGVWGN